MKDAKFVDFVHFKQYNVTENKKSFLEKYMKKKLDFCALMRYNMYPWHLKRATTQIIGLCKNGGCIMNHSAELYMIKIYKIP